MDKLNSESMDLIRINVEKLKSLFPNLVKDGKVDFDEFKEMFSSEIVENNEKYNFTWNGKSLTKKNSLRPSTCTLISDKINSIDWESTDNLYLEGDNLEVLKLLQKTYFNKIKMIYIDPPYNTGKDFVYNDNFTESISNYKEITEQMNRANPSTSGRFHTDWLNMIYARLLVSKNLLTDDGIIFISIDDNELVNLKKVCDEIYGEEQCVAIFPRVTKKGGKSSEMFAKNHDYLLVYAKNKPSFYPIQHDDKDYKNKDEFFVERGYYKLNQTLDYDSLQYSSSLDYEIEINGEKFYPGQSFDKYLERKSGIHNRADWAWRWSKEKFEFGLKHGFIVIKESKNGKRLYTKTYQNVTIEATSNGYEIIQQERTKPISTLEFTNNEYSNDNATKDLDDILGKKIFDYSKPVELLKFLIKISTANNDIVLDFFSGSGTTAQAVLEQNLEDGYKRNFILIQLPELCDVTQEAYKAGYKNICQIGEERIRQVSEKIRKEIEQKKKHVGLFDLDMFESSYLDLGFKVFKLDSTNIKPWDGNVQYNESTIFNLDETIKEERTNLDVAYEIMLKYGIFNMQLKEVLINNKTMYSIGDGHMIICLDNDITMDDVTAIAKLKPRCVVFKELGLKDDNVKINATYTLERLGVEDIKCI